MEQDQKQEQEYKMLTDEELEKVLMLKLGQFSENSRNEVKIIRKLQEERKLKNSSKL